MCIVFFKRHPTNHIKRVIVFNRDEQIERSRSNLGLHFDDKIICAYDLQANGTWLGVNVLTGNYGYLTNYENKPFQMIFDQKYRKGNLLMNYLKSEISFSNDDDGEKRKDYLRTFLDEGDNFNGTNIWLGNILDKNLAFAHNQD